MLRAMLRPLRNTMSRALVDAGRKLATDIGWAQTLNAVGAPNMLGGLLSMHRRGLTPKRIIDGGACMGDWTRLARQVFPAAEFLMVEPQLRHRELLQRFARATPGVHFAPALVGPHDAEEVQFVVIDGASNGTGSSVLPDTSVKGRVVHTPMTTLDRLVRETGFGLPDFIKLDVQGYELAVLQGATECLAAARTVLLEVSIQPCNAGAPLLPEVLSWMEDAGFRAFEVFDLTRHWKADLLVQMDILFLRVPHPLLGD